MKSSNSSSGLQLYAREQFAQLLSGPEEPMSIGFRLAAVALSHIRLWCRALATRRASETARGFTLDVECCTSKAADASDKTLPIDVLELVHLPQLLRLCSPG